VGEIGRAKKKKKAKKKKITKKRKKRKEKKTHKKKKRGEEPEPTQCPNTKRKTQRKHPKKIALTQYQEVRPVTSSKRAFWDKKFDKKLWRGKRPQRAEI